MTAVLLDTVDEAPAGWPAVVHVDPPSPLLDDPECALLWHAAWTWHLGDPDWWPHTWARQSVGAKLDEA